MVPVMHVVMIIGGETVLFGFVMFKDTIFFKISCGGCLKESIVATYEFKDLYF